MACNGDIRTLVPTCEKGTHAEKDTALIVHRLGMKLQLDEKWTDAFLAATKAHPGSIDEIWFATDYGFPPLEVCREHTRILREIKKKYEEPGIRISMQMSNSLGHGEYNSANDCSGLVYKGSPVENTVGQNGALAKYCFCYNGPNFKEYILQYIAIFASICPETLWIDDDLRPGNHGKARYCCFCENCISDFNRRHGQMFDRESLVLAITGDLGWRERWAEFVEESLAKFTKEIVHAVLAVSPDTRFGYQHYNMSAYPRSGYMYIFDALREASGKDPYARPGGGCYSAHNPNDILYKTQSVRWQIANYADYITHIVPEIENLPFVTYGKSPETTCLEASAQLAAGCTGLSFSMMMYDSEPMSWHESELAGFSKHRAYWERLGELSSRTKDSGINLYLPKTLWRSPVEEGDFSWTQEPFDSGTELLRNAVPYAYDDTDTPIYFLHDDVAKRLGYEELLYITSKPVITNASTVKILSSRFDLEPDYFGVEVTENDSYKMFEVFTDHEVNEELERRTWDQTFFTPKGNSMLDIRGDAEVISYFETASKDVPHISEGTYPYGISLAVIKTRAGGKWALFGGNVFLTFISYERRNQILAIAKYLRGKPLAATFWERAQGTIWPRVDRISGKTAGVSILNTSIGTIETSKLEIANPAGERFSFMNADGTVPLRAEKTADGVMVQLPPIGSWSVGTVFID